MTPDEPPGNGDLQHTATPIEHWLERLLSAPAAASDEVVPDAESRTHKSSARNARLLFIVGFDYGELALFMYFALGQEFLAQTTLLLPNRLYATNNDALPGRTIQYGSLSEILTVVDEVRPDVVFLMSGYLFALHNTLSLESLSELNRALVQKGCHVVTSDPFMGLLSDLSEAGAARIFTDSIPTGKVPFLVSCSYLLHKLVNYKERRSYRRAFITCVNVLRNAWHLYPSPVPCDRSAKPRNLSFFNPIFASAPVERGEFTSGDHVLNDKYWLFVIASVDFIEQSFFRGRENLVGGIKRRLRQSLAQRRRPVLLAPDECIQAIVKDGGGLSEVEMLRYCSFRRFISLSLGAEFVFYWNVNSASTGIRLFNELPVFFFDRGHLARSVTPSYELALDCYYCGNEPMYIDDREELTVQKLTARAAAYQPIARSIRDGFARSPSPGQTIETILRSNIAPPMGFK